MRSEMSWIYPHLLRPLLFRQDPERIHNRTMRALSWAGRRKSTSRLISGLFGAPDLPSTVFGLHFPNPIGLAAGMDKHGEALPAWQALGFGFTELGAVTWHAQPGNPPPRVFRAVQEEAIINRMGFNNPGAETVAETLSAWRKLERWPKHPVGMNLGKSKITPLEKAAEDYARSFKVLMAHLDFFVVNVSSPNTPNLRQLQDKKALDEILCALQETQRSTAVQPSLEPGKGGHEKATDGHTTPKPILIKVAPDLSFDALDDIIELTGPREVAGIVATNTTITRPQTSDQSVQKVYAEAGGLSGRPLKERSTEIIRYLYQRTEGKLPIIGVGGIFTAEDAWEKIAAGASLIQVYTGLVYEGPSIAREIVGGLKQRLARAGLTSFGQAVGCKAPEAKNARG
jgi:dihydroorotate dehydrogenase